MRSIVDFEKFANNLLEGYSPSPLPSKPLLYSGETINSSISNLYSVLTNYCHLFSGEKEIKEKIILDTCLKLQNLYEEENKKRS